MLQRVRALVRTGSRLGCAVHTTARSRSADPAASPQQAAQFWQQWHEAAEKGGSDFLAAMALPRDEQRVRALLRVARSDMELVPGGVVRALCRAYGQMEEGGKRALLCVVAQCLGVDDGEVASAAALHRTAWERHGESEQGGAAGGEAALVRCRRRLGAALAPAYAQLFPRIIAEVPEGMEFLVGLRADVRRFLQQGGVERAELAALDDALRGALAAWFSVGFMSVTRVTWDSAASLLEKVCAAERVHTISGVPELKRRVGQHRRVFVLQHPSMPAEPLAVLHVALTPALAHSLPYIDSVTDEAARRGPASHAMFYSISSTQAGLQGIDMGKFLIRGAVARLQQEEPALAVFSTLSPIPGLGAWLRTAPPVPALVQVAAQLGVGAAQGAAAALLDRAGEWQQDAELSSALQRPLLSLVLHYLLREKRRGAALCPVANFHLRNGARLERVNWMGNPSPKGLRESLGFMVNYLYPLEQLDRNSEIYGLGSEITLGEPAKQQLREAWE